ncbi:MAG: HAMP domain-containing histidine kinase [Rhodospirillaceae bacterium]|nr:HAMP domain-containing histidine kinase [Rhodospirillaceae bacterium]
MGLNRLFRTTGFRLAALYAGLFGVSVLVLFGVIYWIVSGALRQQLASNVEDEVAALVEDYRSGGIAHAVDTIERRIESGPHRTTFYVLLDPVGRKIAGNLPNPAARDGWQTLPAPPGRGGDSDGVPEDDEEHQLLAFGTTLSDRSFLIVGEDVYRMVEVQEAIVRAFGWAVAVTVLLGVLGGAILSFGFLRRVDAINRTMRTIIDGRLSDRVPTRGADDELDRLALNLNEMLDRVQVLMESLRQVSSDIAHDLRTPLSRLRQKLEGARLDARCIEDYEAAVDEAIADTDALLKTFAALLRIAQIEAGTRRAAFTIVDISSVFQSIVETYGAVAEESKRTFAAFIEPGIHVRGDRELLTQMLANLVENAIRHTPEGTHIELALKRKSAGSIGTVTDNGPGIPAQAQKKVFQRFFRMERSRSTAGSGLGLSLVAAVADIHGITIALADNEPGLKVMLDFAPKKLA